MNKSAEEILNILKEKIQLGEKLILKIAPLREIDGAMKLQRKIRQEVEFLRRLQTSNSVKVEQLFCSNLRHLEAMCECALRPGVTAVCKTFIMDENNKIVIDIISDGGKKWTKVIARNPKSLSALSAGKASYGSRSTLDQAQDYIKCARLYPYMYHPPKVVFEFFCGLEETLATKLKATGIIVKGETLPDSKHNMGDFNDSLDSSGSDDEVLNNRPDNKCCCESSPPRESLSLEEHSELNVLNLDVTAMMAYVSNMTNGYCSYIFKHDVLTQQATWESERPVKPILDKLFQGKTLVCCQTAWNDFEKIVQTLGGPLEKSRTEELKKVVKIYPDDYGGCDDYPRQNLKVRGNVRLRSKTVFNFGHRIRALTISANDGFVRAAKQQGVTYAAFIHESRALTEGKELTAEKISS